MGIFDRFKGKSGPKSSEVDPTTLNPGDRHYRAWVGHPTLFDQIAAYQIEILWAAGLREGHKLCDVGCGSLRAGRMLIPYLLPGNYYGIEPDKEMLQEGIANEVGRDLIRLKSPTFLHGADFPLADFGVKFDYVLAQSIWSHTYPGLMRDGFEKVASSLASQGWMIATYVEGDPETREPGRGWLYPGNVPYQFSQVKRLLKEAGLVGRELDWMHPFQRWFVAALPEQESEIERFSKSLRQPLA